MLKRIRVFCLGIYFVFSTFFEVFFILSYLSVCAGVFKTWMCVFVTASQHSGTVDDREDDDEDDSEVRCCVCEQPFTEVDKWVFLLF